MLASKYRYQLYIKRAILQAHIAAMDETIYQIESRRDVGVAGGEDYRIDEEAQFVKYLKIVEELD
jgi:hypothetical protein